MKIETLEDVLNEIADRFMIYGACKSEDYDACESENPFCCRVGFFVHYEDRIIQAFANQEKLKEVGLH